MTFINIWHFRWIIGTIKKILNTLYVTQRDKLSILISKFIKLTGLIHTHHSRTLHNDPQRVFQKGRSSRISQFSAWEQHLWMLLPVMNAEPTIAQLLATYIYEDNQQTYLRNHPMYFQQQCWGSNLIFIFKTICFKLCVLGDAPHRPTSPPIFLRHLCVFLLIVASPRRNALTAPIPESDDHVT